MAELHVQQKERNVWPWILAAVILLALLFWFMWGGDDDFNVGTTGVTDSAMVGAAPNTDVLGGTAGTMAGAAVTQYLQFVDDRSSRAAGIAHEYTADGLQKLSAAMSEIAAGDSMNGGSAQPSIDEIRERADALQRNPTSTEHATQAREAFVMVASQLSRMNTNRGNTTAGNLQSLQDAAMAIDPSRGLQEQTNEIEQFFERAGQALRDLNVQ